MTAARPKRWVASRSMVNHIGYRKVSAREEKGLKGFGVFARATLHDSWDEAHAALIKFRTTELEKAQPVLLHAQRHLASVERALTKAQAMQPPTTPTKEKQ